MPKDIEGSHQVFQGSQRRTAKPDPGNFPGVEKKDPGWSGGFRSGERKLLPLEASITPLINSAFDGVAIASGSPISSGRASCGRWLNTPAANVVSLSGGWLAAAL